jgi:hypothetical protein
VADFREFKSTGKGCTALIAATFELANAFFKRGDSVVVGVNQNIVYFVARLQAAGPIAKCREQIRLDLFDALQELYPNLLQIGFGGGRVFGHAASAVIVSQKRSACVGA